MFSQLKVTVSEHSCFDGNGQEYRGTAATTLTGLKCAYWSEQIFLRTSDYPELFGGHNFCRNPGGSESQPWCFVHAPEVRKELCDIPKCCTYK